VRKIKNWAGEETPFTALESVMKNPPFVSKTLVATCDHSLSGNAGFVLANT
jgi:hypothetical protein